MKRRNFLKLVGVACGAPSLPKSTKVYGPMIPFKNGMPYTVGAEYMWPDGVKRVCVSAGFKHISEYKGPCKETEFGTTFTMTK